MQKRSYFKICLSDKIYKVTMGGYNLVYKWIK